MYKKLLFTLLALSTATLTSQSFGEVDERVKQYPRFSSLGDLGIRIQNDFNTDSLRIRAAFIWLTHNISYGWVGKPGANNAYRISYSSEEEKEEAIRDLVWLKIDHAFKHRKGVCIDYSLMLNALLEQFGLASKIITGIAKTKIKDIQGDPTYMNHSWNAVKLQGQWKLMDATWAAGYVDQSSGHFVKEYLDHYFFTDPSDFIRHHLPSREEWQLLDTPVDAASFYSAPIYLPEFCEKGIRLSSRTSGILKISGEQENYIYFDVLPQEHLMHYTINGSGEYRRMAFKKGKGSAYISKIRLRKRFDRQYDYLTVYMNNEPILNFRIEDNVSQ